MTEYLQVRQEGSRLRCILARPAARNALNTAMLERLLAALVQADRDDTLRCITLESADSAAFSAGIDLRERRTLSQEGMAHQSGLVLALVQALGQAPVPVVAAIDGWCLGAGLEIALACDLRIAADSARFGFPEMGLGTYPGGGGAVLLGRLLGPGRAMAVLLGPARIDARRALEQGLVSAVVPAPELQVAVQQQAMRLEALSPAAVRAVRRSLHDSATMPLPQAFAHDQSLRRPLDASGS
jgi:enoyl-CoA hydratase/carnithine racemase